MESKLKFRHNSEKKIKVLISPLDWGLGHATRIVPIIKILLNLNFDVTVGVTKSNFAFFNEEFSEIKKVFVPAYNIKYSNRNTQIFKILISIPRILKTIIKEYLFVKKIHENEKFDLIISDNRFGFRVQKSYCVFITHQLFIKIPSKVKFAEKFINVINKWFINRFNELWIPDFETENNLSGELSHSKVVHKNQKFIGLLSRFENKNEKNQNFERDILVIISGPEPQSTIFQNIIESLVLKSNFTVLIISGKPNENYRRQLSNKIEIISHLPSGMLEKEILASKYVITRAGYSSIMDLFTLRKTAIIVPTPGQTEQEYLAKYLNSKKMFYSVEQNNFNLDIPVNEIVKYNIEDFKDRNYSLKNILIEFVTNQKNKD